MTAEEHEEMENRPHAMARPLDSWDGRVEQAFEWSLRLVYLPVVVLLLAGLGAFVYGTVFFFRSIQRVSDHPFPVGHQIGYFLLDIDLFLIGATMLISAIGLYQLFLRGGRCQPSPQMPAWLHMRDLNDLKARVIAMIVLVLAVSFVEVEVDLPSGDTVLELGGGIALVIVALTIYLRLSSGGHGNDDT